MITMFLVFEGKLQIYGVTKRSTAERFVLMSHRKNLTIKEEIIEENALSKRSFDGELEAGCEQVTYPAVRGSSE